MDLLTVLPLAAGLYNERSDWLGAGMEVKEDWSSVGMDNGAQCAIKAGI